MEQAWLNALFGGILIGLAVSLMLFLNGRVTGISGIINGAFISKKGDLLWRWLFLAGLLSGGFLLRILKPTVFENTLSVDLKTTTIAGLLVGFGTLLGSGCTSGHGVCGLSRLSPRSLVATVTFIAAGILAVFVFRKLGIIL